MRRGLSAHLVDLRGFARYLTRDVPAADDLVQETVVRALASRSQFVDGTNLKAWLFTILRNLFYEQRRRHVRETEILSTISLETEESGQESSGMRDQVIDLSALLWQLPDLLREALILVGAQEMSYEEAAIVCDCPVGTMKARVSRARSRLAEIAQVTATGSGGITFG
ncbi:sigma-70 family RNA polymerase sigma factor [Swaminathania salitolerans]|uniref:RNA polymerase sigma factor n=1 Tax=Swaminathania salitolerans TaxID=182838 RepID=A0A511BN64_9PROT|nr:sigma-70 family RNA polymerase sigma factor [Swaminathania salitolerans]GBQ13626.1 DNA-directed RNA polymerase sigma-E/Sigma-24/FecI [Swaminathania salitolerans LMG 21291]GEL01790.1 RNA polymerase sigma factor [Swaminathania salitolerans]